jgi:hypothetical protein
MKRRTVLVALATLTVAALSAGCSEQAPDKPTTGKEQYQAPQASMERAYSGRQPGQANTNAAPPAGR